MPSAIDSLVSRCERDAVWSADEHEYVLPMGAWCARVGNAAAPGVQARIAAQRYPRVWRRAAAEYARALTHPTPPARRR